MAALTMLTWSCRPGLMRNDASASQGARLYGTYCVPCHGADARNDRGGANPEMRLADVTALPAKEWRRVVLQGRGAMPAFAGRLQPSEVDAIAAYIKGSLQSP